MFMNKKMVAFITSGMMAASMLTVPTFADTEEKIQIKVTLWGDGSVEQQLLDEFNASNDMNIEATVDAIPGDGYGDRLTTSFSSGDGYDIFLSGEGDFYKWVSYGMVTPLDQFIENDTEWDNTIPDSIMKMGVVQDVQDYMIKDFNPMCIWYNKDLFDEFGVEYPSADWTWDDLYAAAQKLTTKNDKGDYETFGFQAQSWTYALGCYLESKGLSYISEDYSTADGYMNSPEMVAALDEYFGWAEGDDRISPTSAETDSYGDGTAMMINNKLAMFVGGGWVKNSLEAAGVNYGTQLLPETHQCYFCTSGFAISTTCKNPEAAWEVVKALTGERGSELRSADGNSYPTDETQLEALRATLTEDQKALLDTMEYSVSPIGMRGPVGSAVNEILEEVIELIIYHEGETADILNDAVANLDVK